MVRCDFQDAEQVTGACAGQNGCPVARDLFVLEEDQVHCIRYRATAGGGWLP
jgi:hypothetical protein